MRTNFRGCGRTREEGGREGGEESDRDYLEQLLAALVTVLVLLLPHHPPDVHVHLVIDLRRQVPIVHRVPAVAQTPMLRVMRRTPFVRFAKLLGEQMVNPRVRQILFRRIVLELLQIDIPSRLELAAAGAAGLGEKGKKN